MTRADTAGTALTRMRREAGRRSLRAFTEAYLPAHAKDPPSSMHLEMFEMLEQATSQRGERLAIAAPRGHAKSTIVSCAFVLWCVCYKLESDILLISNTADQANDFLSFIKAELESNPRLLADFPEVCEPPEAKPGPTRWRRDEIITRSEIKVTALGADRKIRGRRHREHRPSLIILDDIENETEVHSADQRRYQLDWFNKAVLKAGDATTNVVVVGTILHYDSLLAGLLDDLDGPATAQHATELRAVRA